MSGILYEAEGITYFAEGRWWAHCGCGWYSDAHRTEDAAADALGMHTGDERHRRPEW